MNIFIYNCFTNMVIEKLCDAQHVRYADRTGSTTELNKHILISHEYFIFSSITVRKEENTYNFTVFYAINGTNNSNNCVTVVSRTILVCKNYKMFHVKKNLKNW